MKYAKAKVTVAEQIRVASIPSISAKQLLHLGSVTAQSKETDPMSHIFRFPSKKEESR